MSARSIGEVLGGAAPAKQRRTHQPVRRNSYHKGEREHTVWKPIGDGTKRGGRRFWGAMMRAAEEYDDAGKKAGKVNGHLGHVALRVLREMGRRVTYKDGTLDPSLDTLMAWTRRSRGAVVAALARLKDHGFLRWIRRTEPIEDPDPFGPQVKQCSNAYGITTQSFPKSVAELLRRLLGSGPAPDDASWARAQDEAETTAMQKAEPLAVWNRNFGEDEETSRALDRLARAFDGQNASSPGSQNPETEV